MKQLRQARGSETTACQRAGKAILTGGPATEREAMIEANAETDLAVCVAAGIDAAITESVEGVCALCTSSPRHLDFTRVNGKRVYELVLFSPTTDMNHAMEAAKKVGLFIKHMLWQDDDTGGWIMVPKLLTASGVGSYNNTPELAICEAILAMEKDYGD